MKELGFESNGERRDTQDGLILDSGRKDGEWIEYLNFRSSEC